MSNSKSRKLQYLIITQLLEEGSVQLILPDGVKLDIGILQEDKFGNLKKADDYCYIVASRDGRTAMIDSYNLGLQYESDKDTMLFEDEVSDHNGKTIKTFDVV
jgi:hypothetical protein